METWRYPHSVSAFIHIGVCVGGSVPVLEAMTFDMQNQHACEFLKLSQDPHVGDSTIYVSKEVNKVNA